MPSNAHSMLRASATVLATALLVALAGCSREGTPANGTPSASTASTAPVARSTTSGATATRTDRIRELARDAYIWGFPIVDNYRVMDAYVLDPKNPEYKDPFNTVANNARLNDYMQRGGTLVVQYQQGDYVQRMLPPYPVTAPENSRVTDETAPVRILAPNHPVFTFPNRITEADFGNWVQERNLYAFTTFDMRYTPLLETFDRGEMPQRSGELYAQVGQGQYLYTSYSWFRQLPAGVPGAYRQFANLISLSKAPR